MRRSIGAGGEESEKHGSCVKERKGQEGPGKGGGKRALDSPKMLRVLARVLVCVLMCILVCMLVCVCVCNLVCIWACIRVYLWGKNARQKRKCEKRLA